MLDVDALVIVVQASLLFHHQIQPSVILQNIAGVLVAHAVHTHVRVHVAHFSVNAYPVLVNLLHLVAIVLVYAVRMIDAVAVAVAVAATLGVAFGHGVVVCVHLHNIRKTKTHHQDIERTENEVERKSNKDE